jgi:peptidoglycan/xylan/chitin deacetylase (PgdA/CDA1 family)
MLRKDDLPSRAVTVTFDDGYRDNLEQAAPVMKEYGIPGTVFAVTDAVLGGRNLWWDRLHFALRSVARGQGDDILRDPEIPEWIRKILRECRSAAGPLGRTLELSHRLFDLPREKRESVLARLSPEEIAAEQAEERLMLSPAELVELHESGFTIGAHTLSHPFLDELSKDEAAHEVSESIRLLSECLGTPVRFFAFPRGRVAEAVTETLEKHGVAAAFTTEGMLNGVGSDPLRLGRIDSGYCRMSGAFDPAILDLELKGWLHRWRQLFRQRSFAVTS